MTTEQQASVTCPGCGTESFVRAGQRESEAFCRVCDYPLFWARDRVTAPEAAQNTEASLRRLPGTAGRTTLASLTCPVCTEPNPPAALICRRCGSDLHPKPVAPPPAPEPVIVLPPEPVVEPAKPIWPWIVLGVVGLLILIALVLFLVFD